MLADRRRRAPDDPRSHAVATVGSVTAQIPDYVEFDGTRYALAAVLGGPLFEPGDHGIRPQMMHTACWRGYVATYGFTGDRFVLRHLELGMGSTVDGAEITATTELFGRTPSSLPERGTIEFDLDFPLPFTGGLLGGDGFVQEHYVHMGFHPAWKYEHVVELMVEDGVLVESKDRSAEMAEVRRKVKSHEIPDPDRPDAGDLGWIPRSFTLDYSRSLGDIRPPTPPPAP